MNAGLYTLQFEDLSDGWCRARVTEHPRATAEAPTRAEAREMTVVALMGLLNADVEGKSERARQPSLAG